MRSTKLAGLALAAVAGTWLVAAPASAGDIHIGVHLGIPAPWAPVVVAPAPPVVWHPAPVVVLPAPILVAPPPVPRVVVVRPGHHRHGPHHHGWHHGHRGHHHWKAKHGHGH